MELLIGCLLGVSSSPCPFADDAQASPKALCLQPPPKLARIVAARDPMPVQKGEPGLE